MNITLTLNGQTRSIEVFDHGTYVIAYGIKMVTVHGNKTHTGYVLLSKNDTSEYAMCDVIGVGYRGMRGNGTAPRSRMRYVGFSK